MNGRIVYYDFRGILTENELIEKIDKRIRELNSQGFNKNEVFKIIFDCSEFRDCFVDNEEYEIIKKKYKLSLTLGHKACGF